MYTKVYSFIHILTYKDYFSIFIIFAPGFNPVGKSEKHYG